MSQVIEQRIGRLLGNLGLLPFFALALPAWLPLSSGAARLQLIALAAYGAVILSFLGAVHWGFTLLTPQLTKRQAWNTLGWGVTPAMLGWIAVVLAAAGAPAWLVISLLIGDLLLARLVDGPLLRSYPDAPDWYLPLRTRLTAGSVLALVLALFAYV